MARRRWYRFGLVNSHRIFIVTRYRVSSRIRGPFHRGMRVWRALTRSVEEPRSATERPNYELRRVTLLTLHATSNRRYVNVAPGRLQVVISSFVPRWHPRVEKTHAHISFTCIPRVDYVTLLRVRPFGVRPFGVRRSPICPFRITEQFCMTTYFRSARISQAVRLSEFFLTLLLLCTLSSIVDFALMTHNNNLRP